MPGNLIVPEAGNDEAELDSLINSEVGKVKAEQSGVANPPETAETTVAPVAEVPAEKPVESAEAPSAKDAAQKPESQPETPVEQPAEKPGEPAQEKYDFKAPRKTESESEESYAIRVQIAQKLAERKAAPEHKKPEIQAQMDDLRNELRRVGSVNGSQSFINNNDGASSNVQPEDGEKQPRYIKEEDLDAILAQREIVVQNRATINTFFDKYTEFSDPDVRDVFIDFFDSNYKIEGKSSKEVAGVLDLAKQAFFRQSETVQERVLKGANVQEKVNAMQFPGGTIVRNGLTPQQQASVDELKAQGLTEERARELILD